MGVIIIWIIKDKSIYVCSARFESLFTRYIQQLLSNDLWALNFNYLPDKIRTI